MTLVLRADSIGKAFAGRSVLTAATLRVHAGEISFLVGRNGCGKSTLLNIATGALQPDYGTVTFKGRAHLRQTWHALARQGLYYLPDRDLLAPSRTVRQHLIAIARQFGVGDTEAAARVCHIVQFLDRRCGDLSTGERRRAEVATAIARAPDCLLADEPLRHIDPHDRSLIANALRCLSSRGCAVVVTGHDVEDLFELADSVVWCTDGTTYELGTPAAAATNWRFAATYLGAARAVRLVGDLATQTPAT
ncbi:MAG TPA: ABC transporter ATP-binding protein [Gemmatimonadales bacterium]|jgi:ABC-type multidrug transport system ATPase subunit